MSENFKIYKRPDWQHSNIATGQTEYFADRFRPAGNSLPSLLHYISDFSVRHYRFHSAGV